MSAADESGGVDLTPMVGISEFPALGSKVDESGGGDITAVVGDPAGSGLLVEAMVPEQPKIRDSAVPEEASLDSAVPEETTILGKREKAEVATAAAGHDGEEESVPPTKKVKAAADGDELGAVAAATEGEQNGAGAENPKPVQLGPKTFLSGVEMFTYFYDLLHAWVSNVDVNKYEFLVLSDLISKGHRDAETKIGQGIQSFQVRFHPGWRSRCYYLIRTDGTMDDFSYRKCVDKIMPLPENMYSPSGALLVDKLFGPEDDKWSKKSKGKENFGDGWKQSNRGGRGGRGDRRGGGRGRFRV